MQSTLPTSRFKFFCLGVSALAILLSAGGCNHEEPIKIGFVGGLTGRVSDMGIAGRDGAQLAIEESNARNGVGGQSVLLLVRDDRQERAAARGDTEPRRQRPEHAAGKNRSRRDPWFS